MAVPAQNGQNQSAVERSRPQKALNGAEYVAVRLYASGKTRSQVAEVLKDKLYGHLDSKTALKKTRLKLRSWEETQWFRDAVYDYAIGLTDMDIPRILGGVRERAKRGRVDAARLALEVTGRHNPRGEQAGPAVVQINFGGNIPRPGNRVVEPNGPEVLEAVIEDAEVIEEVEEPSNGSTGRTSDLSAYRKMLAKLPGRRAI